ncbi:MAG: SWIM zinc finger family protein [Prevotella conceptionensis]
MFWRLRYFVVYLQNKGIVAHSCTCALYANGLLCSAVRQIDGRM